MSEQITISRDQLAKVIAAAAKRATECSTERAVEFADETLRAIESQGDATLQAKIQTMGVEELYDAASNYEVVITISHPGGRVEIGFNRTASECWRVKWTDKSTTKHRSLEDALTGISDHILRTGF